jgi:serine/threonine-protein kinase RsbW
MGEAAPTQWHAAPSAGSPVEIRVNADSSQLPLLRIVAETVALSVDLTVDEASDVRLAVDEAASLLIEMAVPDAVLGIRFAAERTALRVRLATVAAAPQPPDHDGFGWQILQRLIDSVVAEQESYHAEQRGFPTVIEFTRNLGRGLDARDDYR